MKRHLGHTGSCSCTNCVYKSRSKLPSVQHLIETGSKIDRLYYGKYLPLRERKLLGKLIRTRAVYDDVRTQLLSGSGSSDQTRDTEDEDSTERSSAVTKIVDLVDRGQIGSSGTSKLSTCCSCCSCSSMKKIPIEYPRVHSHNIPPEAIERYNLEAKRKGRARRNRFSTKVSSKLRAVRFKAKRIRSAPCACTLDISSVFKRLSKRRLKASPSKGTSTFTTEAPSKSVKIDHRPSKLARCFCNLKLGKHPMKSLHRIKRSKISESRVSGDSEERDRKRFRIRKDSLVLFRDKLKKKASLKDWECGPDVCEPEECVPEECYEKIKARRAGRKRRNKYPNKSSGTDISQSHVSISTRKKVSNVNVGKKVKKINIRCMCPPKTTTSETTSAATRGITFRDEEPSVIGENVRLQTEKKKSKGKSVSASKKQAKKQSKLQMAALCDCPPTEPSLEGSQLTQSSSQTSRSSYTKSMSTKKSISHAKKLQKKQSKMQTAAVCDCPPTEINIEGSRLNQSYSLTSKSAYNRSMRTRKSISTAKKPKKKQSKLQTGAVCECPPIEISLVGSQLSQSASRSSKSTYNMSMPTRKSISTAKKTMKKQSKLQTGAVCECPPTEISLEGSQLSQSASRSSKSTYSKSMLTKKTISTAKKQQKKQSKSQTGAVCDCPPTRTSLEESQLNQSASLASKSDYSLVQKQPKSEVSEELESHPSRQAVRIGSTFSFNIEFYKDKPSDNNGPDTHESNAMREDLYESSPSITKKRGRRIKNKHRLSQSVSSHSKRNAHVGHGLKRCFCTLKIPKRKQKPHRSSSRKTMTSLNVRNVDVVGQMRETQTKPFKRQGASIAYVTPPLTSRPRRLLPYECEPYFCTPGECDPYECEKRIRVRNRNGSKYLSKDTNTLRKPKRSAVTLTSQYKSSSSRKVQSRSPRHKKTKSPRSPEIENSQISLSRSNRQGVRIGSSFSFNIEFSKDKIGYEPEAIEIQEPPRKEKKHYRHTGIKVHKPRLRHITSQTIKTEKSKQTHTKKGVDKCICPANILKEKSTVTPLEYSQGSSILMRHKSVATEKEHLKHYRNRRLLPYECEPGVCAPGECDPYECDKLIKKRNAKSRNRGANTCICPEIKSKISSISKSATSSKSGYSRKTKQRKTSRYERDMTVPSSQPGKQVVRIGSNISFNIEFYKEKRPVGESRPRKVVRDNESDDRTRRGRDTGVQKSRRRDHHASFNTETRVKEKGIGVSSVIKRCFCTLKFHKKGKHPKLSKDDVTKSPPKHRRKHRREHTSSTEHTSKIVLKPKYCKADVCDHHECCKEPKHRHRKRKHPHTDADNTPKHAGDTPNKYQFNIYEEETRQKSKFQQPSPTNAAPAPAPQGNNQINLLEELMKQGPQNFNQFYYEERIVQQVGQSPGQPRRAGTLFSSNTPSKQGKPGYNMFLEHERLTSERKPQGMVGTMNQVTEVQTNKTKTEIKKPEEIKVKKERKPLNIGLKLKNAMGSFGRRLIDIRERIKRIKLIRSRSQYIMVKVKKPKPGELAPEPANVSVTAAYCQVIRDVDYTGKKPNLHKYDQNESEYLDVMWTREGRHRRLKNDRSKKIYHEEYSRTKLYSKDYLFEKNYPSYSTSRIKQNLKIIRRHREIFPDSYFRNSSSKQCISYDSSIGLDIKSTVDSLAIKTSALYQIRNNRYRNSNNTRAMKSPFQHSYIALNVKMPNKKGHTLEKFECEPGFCVPGECDPNECLKRINSRSKSSKSSGADRHKNKHATTATGAQFCTKCKTAQSNRTAIPKQKSSKGKPYIDKRPASHEIANSSRQSLSIGSNFSFNAEFYKQPQPVEDSVMHKTKCTKSSDAKSHIQKSTKGVHARKKPCQSTESQKKVNNEDKGIGPMLKRCFCTLKLQKKGNTANKVKKPTQQTVCKQTMANEPFGNITLYQNRKVMTDKLKPYECAPGVCVPGQCDPKECYKLIQKRLNKGREQCVGTDKAKMKSGQTKLDKKHNAKNGQLITPKTRSTKDSKHAGGKGDDVYKVLPNRKQAVRFGSNITFNLEFYKDSSSEDLTPVGNDSKNDTVNSIKSNKTGNKAQDKSKSKHHNEANVTSPKTKDAKGSTSTIEKCFCTLKLKKKEPKMGANSKKPTKTKKNKSHVSSTNDKCDDNSCPDSKVIQSNVKSKAHDDKKRSKNKISKNNDKSGACDDDTYPDHEVKQSNAKSKAHDEKKGSKNKSSKNNAKPDACDDSICPDSKLKQSNVKSKAHDDKKRSKNKSSNNNAKFDACDDSTYPDSKVKQSNVKSKAHDDKKRSKNKSSNNNADSDACDDSTCPDSKVKQSNVKSKAHDDNKRSKKKVSKNDSEFNACEENTTFDNKAITNEKDIKNHRKRSKNTKVHKEKYDMSIKSDIPKKKTAKAGKRLTRSFECELHSCNSDPLDPIELITKQKPQSLKGVSKSKPKTNNKAEIGDITDVKKSRLSLIQRCVCALTHQVQYNRNDLIQQQCAAKELKKNKSRKSKLNTKIEKENGDLNKQTDIETIMPPTKKSKGGSRAKSKGKMAADHDRYDHQSGEPCKCSMNSGNKKDKSQANKGKSKGVVKDTNPLNNDSEEVGKNTKPKKGKGGVTKKSALADHPEMCPMCKLCGMSKVLQNQPTETKTKIDSTTKKKSKKKVKADDSKQLSSADDTLEVDKNSKPKDKNKTAKAAKNVNQTKSPKQRAKLVKTELNGYSFEMHGKNCQCSHCTGGDNKTPVKKRESKKKFKQDVKAKTDASYRGLYPCNCSDKEIKKKPSSNKSEKEGGKEDDGLCPMCKHCKDKEPLMGTLLQSGRLFMGSMNKMLATIKSKCEKQLEHEPPPDVPLFEMVVNRGDMSIMNKEEIIDKVKSSSDHDRRKKQPLSPSFEMMIDRSDASIMHTDEIRNKIMANAKMKKTPYSKSMQSKSLKYEIPKSSVKGTKSERQAYSFQIHGKNCKCCYCATKGRRKKDSQSKPQARAASFSKNEARADGMPAYSKKKPITRGPCICGSTECKMELKQEMQDKLDAKKRAKQKPCVCGSKICGAETKKSVIKKGKPKKKKKAKKKGKEKPKSQRPDLTAIGSLLCGKIGFQEFKYKIRGKVETEHQKRERINETKSANAVKEQQIRKKVYAKEDAKRRKERVKTDKIAMKDVKRYKNTPDGLLCAESVLDVGKLGFSALAGVLRTVFRGIRDPKASVASIKELARDPEHAYRTVKATISGSGVAGTANRIKHRIGAMDRTQEFIATMESHPLSNYMVHFADKDPKKRLAKHQPGKRVREPLDFQCSLFMASLRKRPHLWVYYMCPWFYPHCISLVGIWRQFTDVILFLLAVAVWSPCIFAMEACRALMCCFLCTG